MKTPPRGLQPLPHSPSTNGKRCLRIGGRVVSNGPAHYHYRLVKELVANRGWLRSPRSCHLFSSRDERRVWRGGVVRGGTNKWIRTGPGWLRTGLELGGGGAGHEGRG